MTDKKYNAWLNAGWDDSKIDFPEKIMPTKEVYSELDPLYTPSPIYFPRIEMEIPE